MNERIKKLAEQAGLKIEYQMINPPKPLQILGGIEEFEKFAELIVQECANIVTKRKDAAIDADWHVDEAMSNAVWDIEEHFGVEE